MDAGHTLLTPEELQKVEWGEALDKDYFYIPVIYYSEGSPNGEELWQSLRYSNEKPPDSLIAYASKVPAGKTLWQAVRNDLETDFKYPHEKSFVIEGTWLCDTAKNKEGKDLTRIFVWVGVYHKFETYNTFPLNMRIAWHEEGEDVFNPIADYFATNNGTRLDVENSIVNLGEDKIPWRLFTPEGASKEYCVLWLQGWSSSMDSHSEGVERMTGKTKTVFATLDLAGHGLHRQPLEDSTRQQHHEEIVAVYDELKRRGFQKIIVIGSSYGAYMAALLVAERPVHVVVLRAPANYPDDEFELKYRETWRWKDYAKYLEDKKTNDALTNTSATKAIHNFDGFVYVLEHEFDNVIPSAIPKSYFKAAKHSNYLIIPKVKHSPKLMSDPNLHYKYAENVISAIVESAKLQDKLTAK